MFRGKLGRYLCLLGTVSWIHVLWALDAHKVLKLKNGWHSCGLLPPREEKRRCGAGLARVRVWLRMSELASAAEAGPCG